MTLPAVTTRLYASDEIEYYAWLRSAVFDGDVDFDNDYRYFADSGAARDPLFRTTFLDERNSHGRNRNFAPIGTAVLWAPFFAAGHVAALVSGAPADGFSRPYIAAVTYGSAAYGFAALLLTLSIARQIAGRGLGATLLVWLATPLVFYMYVAPGFSHAGSAFAVALFLWIWLRVRVRWSPAGAALLGAAGALMAMVREQDIFFVAGPVLDFVRSVVSRSTERTPPRHPMMAALAGTLAFLAAVSPQLVAYVALNGHLGPDSNVSGKMVWTAPYGLLVLFSREHGLFAWTPLALLAVAGLVGLALGRVRGAVSDAAWLAVLCLVMFALQAYVAGSVQSWTVARSFGQRRFVALTPILGLGLAAFWTMASAHGRAVAWSARALVVLCLWWNLGLMMLFSLNEMDRERLTLGANARAVFVELPVRAPGIAWRYFTDRSSFYGRPRQ